MRRGCSCSNCVVFFKYVWVWVLGNDGAGRAGGYRNNNEWRMKWRMNIPPSTHLLSPSLPRSLSPPLGSEGKIRGSIWLYWTWGSIGIKILSLQPFLFSSYAIAYFKKILYIRLSGFIVWLYCYVTLLCYTVHNSSTAKWVRDGCGKHLVIYNQLIS